MQRIVVLNPKGGSGKTTIAINLAGYFASRQQRPVLMDFDPQGSSLRWVRKRQPSQPLIHAIAAFERDSRTTRAFQLRVPEATTHVIVDTPAAVEARQLPEVTRDAHKIIVPVLPSDIDIHTCSRTIRDLLLIAKIRRDEDRIGVHEMKSYIAQSDVEQWQPLVDWLDRRGPRPPQDASAPAAITA